MIDKQSGIHANKNITLNVLPICCLDFIQCYHLNRRINNVHIPLNQRLQESNCRSNYSCDN